ncbi:MAG: glutathione S-transferase N-terminal domain-containing protein [Gemmatimonadetes bacterium]|nr:glutathione S-transferase N-terminal domain-containing protein [Gemmatimonadota bacterium]
MSLTLYVTPFCPWCERVKVALDGLGLAYEEVSISPNRMLREEIVRLTGQRQVPVLVDGDLAIHDSTRILEHLRRTYPAGRTEGNR